MKKKALTENYDEIKDWYEITEPFPKEEIQFAYDQLEGYARKWIDKGDGIWAVAIPMSEHKEILKNNKYVYKSPQLEDKRNNEQ